MYMDNAALIWNGNGVTGKDNIQTFLTDLPPTEHTVHILDAQPITSKYNCTILKLIILTY